MKNTILILDDSEDRIAAMQSLLIESCPEYEIKLFDNAPDTIEWINDNIASIVLMSLDHDLGPNRVREGQVFDPGTGKDVVDYLVTQSPVCPVVVHSSNYMGRDSMIFSLQGADWEASFVMPQDGIEWIYDSWKQEIDNHLKMRIGSAIVEKRMENFSSTISVHLKIQLQPDINFCHQRYRKGGPRIRNKDGVVDSSAGISCECAAISGALYGAKRIYDQFGIEVRDIRGSYMEKGSINLGELSEGAAVAGKYAVWDALDYQPSSKEKELHGWKLKKK